MATRQSRFVVILYGAGLNPASYSLTPSCDRAKFMIDMCDAQPAVLLES